MILLDYYCNFAMLLLVIRWSLKGLGYDSIIGLYVILLNVS